MYVFKAQFNTLQKFSLYIIYREKKEILSQLCLFIHPFLKKEVKKKIPS